MSLHCSTLVERGWMESFGSCTCGKVVTWSVSINQTKSSYSFEAVKIFLDAVVLIFILRRSWS